MPYISETELSNLQQKIDILEDKLHRRNLLVANLRREKKTHLSKLIDEVVGKNVESFWIKQKGSLDVCAGCQENYVCCCKGINKAKAEIRAKIEEMMK